MKILQKYRNKNRKLDNFTLVFLLRAEVQLEIPTTYKK